METDYFHEIAKVRNDLGLESLDEAAIQILTNREISNQDLLDYCIRFLNRYGEL